MFRTIVFFGLITAALGSEKLDVLVNAAASFSATIQQQLETLQSDPSPAELAEKTIDYSEAKTAYFKALRAEVPELTKIATGKEKRPPELDTFAAAFAVAGEDQEKAADKETLVLLERFSGNPVIEKAKAEFKRAQKLKSDSIRILTGSILLDRTEPSSRRGQGESRLRTFLRIASGTSWNDDRPLRLCRYVGGLERSGQVGHATQPARYSLPIRIIWWLRSKRGYQ